MEIIRYPTGFGSQRIEKCTMVTPGVHRALTMLWVWFNGKCGALLQIQSKSSEFSGFARGSLITFCTADLMVYLRHKTIWRRNKKNVASGKPFRNGKWIGVSVKDAGALKCKIETLNKFYPTTLSRKIFCFALYFNHFVILWWQICHSHYKLSQSPFELLCIRCSVNYFSCRESAHALHIITNNNNNNSTHVPSKLPLKYRALRERLVK